MANHRTMRDVTVSFHSFTREQGKAEDKKPVPFTQAEFDQLYTKLAGHLGLSIKDKEVSDKVRYQSQAIIDRIEKFDERYMCGLFKAAHWGHSFENSEKGEISADSLNMRRFFFLIYLSQDGRLYVACQYLGNFGGYQVLRNTIFDSLAESKQIVARSISVMNYYFKNAIAQSVTIDFNRQSEDFAAKGTFGKMGAVTFRDPGNEAFNTRVRQSILSVADQEHKAIKKGIADLLNSSDVMEIDEQDIANCTVLALVMGRKKKLHLLDASNFATRFPAQVDLVDGHPVYEPLKARVLELLETEVLEKE